MLTKNCQMFDDMPAEALKAEKDAGYDVTAPFTRVEQRCGQIFHIHTCNFCGLEEEYELYADYLYIGDCPSEEEPFKTYTTAQICKALIIQLRNTFGYEPEGARLEARYEAGSDGRTVVCHYEPKKPLSVAYAFMLEGHLPERWSPSAKEFLKSITA
jgi:hypothetical protein